MDLREYAAVVWRRKTVVLIALTVAGLTTLIAVSTQAKRYRATATVRTSAAALVIGDAVRTDDVTYTDRLISTYTKILEGPARDALKRQFNLAAPPTLSVKTPANTELMEIAVSAGSPRAAADEANSAAHFLISYVKNETDASTHDSLVALSRQIAQAKASVNNAQTTYDALVSGASTQQLTAARGELDAAQRHLGLLQDQYAQVATAAAARDSSMSIVAPATPATGPYAPRAMRILTLTLFGALLVGLGLAFLFENLDRRIYTDKQVRELVDSPVLGWIPNTRRRRPLVFADGGNQAADAFRRLRNALFAQSQVGSFTVVSADRAEGKSTIVANLAHAAAQAGMRVAAVDADLRSPSLHRLFGWSNESGLTRVLNHEQSLDEAVQETSWRNLHLLPAGPPVENGAELLGSPRMDEILKTLRERYDVVLVDTPAVLGAPDALPVATKTQGVLLVIARGRATADDVRNTLNQLETVEAQVTGVIVNRWAATRNYGYPKADETAAPGRGRGLLRVVDRSL
jgi:capsular exopolysaccharide synthesis family protein